MSMASTSSRCWRISCAARTGRLDGRILEDVCEKIKTKIGWPRERWNVPVRPFLDAFYRAQRGLLEQKMLFGQRREWKKG